MILDYVKTFLSEITKDLLSDELKVVKEQIRTLNMAVAVMIVTLFVLLIINIIILVKCL